MPLPRRGILIRIVVYGALISFFGWRACAKYQEEKATEAEIESVSREAKLPDGRTIEYLELTPEQAEKMFGAKVERGEPSPPSEGAAAAPVVPPAAPAPAPAPAPTPAPEATPPGAPAAPAEPAAPAN